MSLNTPVFAKRDNPIKRAIIKWLEDHFDEFPKINAGKNNEEFRVFRLGDLEYGTLEILGDKKPSSGAVRAHTGNLKTDRIISVHQDSETKTRNIPELKNQAFKRYGRVLNQQILISREQLLRLQRFRDNWDAKSLENPVLHRSR